MRVLCFGDSNTYGYDPRSYLGGRYPAQSRWVDLLARETGWEVINGGENGREIPSRPIELPQAPDLLIVMLGTNDLLQGADADTAESRMEKFLARLPIDRNKILLVSPPPMQLGTWVTEKRLVSAPAQLAERYAALAKRMGVRFADAAPWQIELAFDGVHFTEAGHRAFASGIGDALSPAE